MSNNFKNDDEPSDGVEIIENNNEEPKLFYALSIVVTGGTRGLIIEVRNPTPEEIDKFPFHPYRYDKFKIHTINEFVDSIRVLDNEIAKKKLENPPPQTSHFFIAICSDIENTFTFNKLLSYDMTEIKDLFLDSKNSPLNINEFFSNNFKDGKMETALDPQLIFGLELNGNIPYPHILNYTTGPLGDDDVDDDISTISTISQGGRKHKKRKKGDKIPKKNSIKKNVVNHDDKMKRSTAFS